jgi:transcriptional regulator GlxA family with amidase domain
LTRLLKPTRLTFWDHVHMSRTREAARLLIETELNIKEITASVGYADDGLERPFAWRFGALPREWRRARRHQARLTLLEFSHD